MKHRHIFMLLVMACSLVGCGDPKIDAATDDSLKDSIKTVRESLPEDKREEFDQALLVMLFADLSDLAALSDTDQVKSELRDRLDGMTGLEIIAEAEIVRAEREEERERQRVEREAERAKRLAEREAEEQRERIAKLEDLQQEIEVSATNDKLLQGFRVERSRFYFDQNRFSSGPVIELKVVNETPHAISRVYFEGTLATPGRSIPWVEDTFSHAIRGGLEPGESATWNLSPNRFGEWGRAPRDRDDVVLTVRVVQLDGPNDETIAESTFDSEDAERMRELAAGVPSDKAAKYLSLLDDVERRREEQRLQQQAIQAKRDTAMKKAELAEQIRQMKAEVQELVERRKQAEEDATQLSRVSIERSRFYFSDSGFRKSPVIEITAKNETGHAISRIYFDATLSSPGRKTPWLEDKFNYEITGGLESGEGDTWKLAPNMFSDWGKVPQDRNDMVLTLKPYKIEGANGRELFNTKFSAEDEARLLVLEQQLRELDSE